MVLAEDLLVVSKHVWQVADHRHRESLRNWLAGVVLGHTPVDQWSAVLIGMLAALDAIGELGVGDVKALGGRIEELVGSGWAADEVTKAITEASLRAMAGRTHVIDS